MNHNYSIKYNNILLRPLLASDVELLRKWRNDEKNSVYLRSIPFITPDMQKKWYEDYLNRNNEVFFAIEAVDLQNRVVGSLSLYDIDSNTCMFGKLLVGDEEAHGKKIGVSATIAAIKIAFDILDLDKVYLYVYANNAPALKAYKEAGFKMIDSHKDCDGNEEYTMAIERKIGGVNSVRALSFQQKGDSRGHLVIIEGEKDIPFDIKRAFYIYGSDKDVVRGQHANKRSEFVLINVAGKSKVKVKDGYGKEKVFCLDKPHTGIYIPSMIWKDMYDFSEDSVLLVLASTHYDPKEYIRNYDEFVEEINSKE